jgi:hypothetical protein
MPILLRAGGAAPPARGNRDRVLQTGHLEGMHFAPLGIPPTHDVLDHTVLVSGIHRLEHDQDRPTVRGIEPFLESGKPLNVGGQDGIGLGFVEVEPAIIGRIDRGKPKTAGMIDA